MRPISYATGYGASGVATIVIRPESNFAICRTLMGIGNVSIGPGAVSIAKGAASRIPGMGTEPAGAGNTASPSSPIDEGPSKSVAKSGATRTVKPGG